MKAFPPMKLSISSRASALRRMNVIYFYHISVGTVGSLTLTPRRSRCDARAGALIWMGASKARVY
jgi:hypothetical protein